MLHFHRDYSALYFHLWWFTAGYQCNDFEYEYVCACVCVGGWLGGLNHTHVCSCVGFSIKKSNIFGWSVGN